jgi:DMSO/TMAO reductase YedYZ molybdopterin-dependent catalytic subunit
VLGTPESRRTTLAWAFVGVVAGLAGLGTSYLTAAAMNMRLSPVTAVAELVIRLTPGRVVETAIQTTGTKDKPLLIAGIIVISVLLYGGIGVLARRRWWLPAIGFGLLALVGAIATLRLRGAVVTDLAPVLVGFVTWMVGIALLGERLRRIQEPEERTETDGSSRRVFLGVVAGVVGVAALSGLLGRFAGRRRRRVEQARRLLRLPGTQPDVPDDVRIGVDGVSSWMTSVPAFYIIHTATVQPTIPPDEWRLRIHGLVENEIEIDYQDLLARPVNEAWVTLNCVSNPVGGTLIGNGWWTGALLADLLEEAGPLPEADALLQTSDDGWTCGTPLDVVMDGRDAMLVYAMNGKPLEIEHGFPVRTLVPGLYGYVSATKWVVDIEVSRFEDFTAFWTDKGWGERGPVKMSSRVEVPRSGSDVRAGEVTVAGTAWSQHTGISAVEVAVDGGAWQPAEIAGVPSTDTWVQWRAVVEVGQGDHLVRVRATDRNGMVQTGEKRDVLPDGATGWHEIDFSASA